MEFPKQKIQANNSKSVLKPNRRIHIRPKHKCRSVFSLLFLLIKLAPLISVSSVTEVSVLLRRLYSTEVLNSVCEKNFRVRGKFVRPAISRVWLHFRGMNWRAKSSLCRQPYSFLLRMRKNSSRDSEATEIRHVFRQFCASFAAIELANNQPAQALFCFPAFLPLV